MQRNRRSPCVPRTPRRHPTARPRPESRSCVTIIERTCVVTSACLATVAAILEEEPHLRRFARRFVRCEADGEDLVQDTILLAYKARDRFEPGTSARAWTMRSRALSIAPILPPTTAGATPGVVRLSRRLIRSVKTEPKTVEPITFVATASSLEI